MMWEAAARNIGHHGGKVLMGRELQKLEFDLDRKVWHIEVATVREAARGILPGTLSARRP